MRVPRGLATHCWPSEHRFPSLLSRPLYRHTLLPSHRSPLLRLYSTATPRTATMMDESIKQHYLADSPPTVVRLEVKPHFDKLEDPTLRKYAHYISRLAILGPFATVDTGALIPGI